MCRYVAGCDGPASTVRRAAGIGWRGGPYRQEVVLADIDVEGDLTPDVAHAVAGKDGMLFLFAIGERSTWRLLCTRPARGGGTPGQPDDPIPSHELDRLLQATGLGIRVAEIGWSARVPLEHRVATRYRAGPLFLAGDAAHVHSPAGGQGMNIGIQDAANLGWKLAFAASSADLSPETLLSSYEAERRPVARHVVALTQLLFWGEASTDRVASFIRRAAVPATAPALPFMLRRRHLVAGGVRVLSQLNVGYPDSPISLEHGVRRRGLRAGDRVRDQSVTCEGRRRRLHELLAGPGVHLLLDRQASALTVADLGPHVHCHRIDDWPATGVLGVRPDGYIGYCDPTASPAHLREWLALIAADHQHQPARGDLHDHHS
jgi:hypothetical protein